MSGARSKRLGSSYEQEVRREWIELGFEECETARYESKKRDDQKVDLMHTAFFNIQCKAYKSLPNPRKVLDEMPDDENYNIMFHKLNVGKGKKRPDDLVIMHKEDFYEIVKMLKAEKII